MRPHAQRVSRAAEGPGSLGHFGRSRSCIAKHVRKRGESDILPIYKVLLSIPAVESWALLKSVLSTDCCWCIFDLPTCEQRDERRSLVQTAEERLFESYTMGDGAVRACLEELAIEEAMCRLRAGTGSLTAHQAREAVRMYWEGLPAEHRVREQSPVQMTAANQVK